MKRVVAGSTSLVVALLGVLAIGARSAVPVDPLPSWNETPSKLAILEFVRDTTTPGSPGFVSPEERVATFDQDGTLWVEHPVYTQLQFCLDRVHALVEARPELASVEPFRTVLTKDHAAIARLSRHDLETLLAATLTGMSVETFRAEVAAWLARAEHPRWKRPYTELTYLPMRELLAYMRANGYRTYIVTGGGQDFVRVYAEATYGIPPEQVIGSVGGTTFGYGADGEPQLTKDPSLLLYDDGAGKPEGIHLVIGRRPRAAFGNSTGDREMLEYTDAGGSDRLVMLVLHDDATREYAYGPAEGLPDTKIGTFTQELFDDARADGWIVVSMKDDWRRIFGFE